MSDEPLDDREPVPGSAPPTEERVAGAMAAAASAVRPDAGAWSRIDQRLDVGGPSGAGGVGPAWRSTGSARRPALVAAVFVVFVVLAGAAVVRARSTTEVEVATAPTGEQELALVALTADGRLVELGLDGVERREIYRTPDDGSRLEGRIAVSPLDRTIYVQRIHPSEVPCGDAGLTTPEGAIEGMLIGELVAIPFGGGEPSVVADVGRDPDIAPGSNRLVFRTGAGPCSAGDSSVGVVDLVTGAAGTVRFVSTDVGPEDELRSPAAIMGEDVYVPVGSSTVSEVRWSTDGRSIYALIPYGSGARYRAVVRVELEIGSDVVTPVLAEVLVSPVLTASYTPIAENGGLIGISAFDVGSAATTGDAFVLLRPSVDEPSAFAAILGGLVRRELVARPPGTQPDPAQDRGVIDLGIRATIDVGSLGVGPLGDTDVDVEPRTGRVLVVVRAAGTGEQAPANLVLVVDDAGTVRPVGGPASLRSAAWVWADRSPVEPSTTVATDLAMPSATLDPRSGTTVPLDPFVTWVPTTAAGEPEVPMTDRPDDAAAIADAYDALFERGDRTAFEGGTTMEPTLEEAAQVTPGGPTGATVRVTGIDFVDADTATVTFLLDHPTWGAPVPLTGGSVRRDGRWQVSTSTMCMLLGRVGVDCPGAP